MYIKTVNIDSKYKCIVMRGNDPSRVNRGKGYKVINWLNCCDVLSGVDGVHPSSDRGRLEHFSPLLFRLILTICWSPQYKVDGWLGSRGMFSVNNDPVSCGSDCYPVGWLSNISSEVPGPNQFFHKEFQALSVVGFVAMVPMIITP